MSQAHTRKRIQFTCRGFAQIARGGTLVSLALMALAVEVPSAGAETGTDIDPPAARRAMPGVIIEPFRPKGDARPARPDTRPDDSDAQREAPASPGCPLNNPDLDVFA